MGCIFVCFEEYRVYNCQGKCRKNDEAIAQDNANVASLPEQDERVDPFDASGRDEEGEVLTTEIMEMGRKCCKRKDFLDGDKSRQPPPQAESDSSDDDIETIAARPRQRLRISESSDEEEEFEWDHKADSEQPYLRPNDGPCGNAGGVTITFS